MGENDDAAYGSDTDMDEQNQYGGSSESEDAVEQTDRRADEDEEESETAEDADERECGQDETDPE